MELIKCSEKYWEFIRILRTDKRVLCGFIKNTEITPKIQKEYMKKYEDCYRVALIGRMPAGFVGVIGNDIRVCTHPDFQGKGVAKFMINECMKIWPNATAKIKIDNIASIKAFEKSGFKKKYYILEAE